MERILGHWRKIIYFFCGLKALAILIMPIGGDFLSWIGEASSVLYTVMGGKLPALSTFGVYIGIEVVLAPFFWLWTILPVQHPNLTTLVQYTSSTVSLEIIMKIPVFLFDIATLLLVMRIARLLTNSERKSIVAGLVWFVNPFNFYQLYYFGAMDIIPMAVFMLAIMFESETRWFRSGLLTIISGLLRIFAFVSYLFFFPLMKNKTGRGTFILGSALPIAFGIVFLYLSHDSLATVFNIPAKQFWLLEFLGWSVLGMQFVRLSPVLVVFQLYIVARFWRQDTNIVYLASVSLLALLLGATLYGGEGHHFFWVSPLLSICVALRPKESWIYILTFFTALMSPTVNPFGAFTPNPPVVDTFLAGAFDAMEAIYLLMLNLSNIQLSSQLKHDLAHIEHVQSRLPQ